MSLVFSGVYVWRYSALIFISSTRQVRRRSGPTVDGGGGVKVTPKWRKRKSGYRKHLHRDRKYKHIIQLPAHRAHTHTDKGTHRLATVFTILHKKDWSGPLLASCRLSNVTTHLNVGYNHNHVPWFYSVYVPNRDLVRARSGSSERGRWCVIVSHIRIASLSVKLLNFLLRHYQTRARRGVMKGSTSPRFFHPSLARCYSSWGFINVGSKRVKLTSHPKTTFIERAREVFYLVSLTGPLAPRTPPLIMVDVKTSEYLVFSI